MFPPKKKPPFGAAKPGMPPMGKKPPMDDLESPDPVEGKSDPEPDPNDPGEAGEPGEGGSFESEIDATGAAMGMDSATTRAFASKIFESVIKCLAGEDDSGEGGEAAGLPGDDGPY